MKSQPKGFLLLLAVILILTGLPAPVKAAQAPYLTGIWTDGGRLFPYFQSDVTEYDLFLPSGSTTFTSAGDFPEDSGYSLSYSLNNGEYVDAGKWVAFGNLPVSVGENSLQLKVTSTDNAETIYTVHVHVPQENDSRLRDLQVTAGPLTPAFSESQTSYSVTVPYSVSSTMLGASLWDSLANVTVNDANTPSDVTFGYLSLPVGTSVYSFKTTSKDLSAHTTYTVTITRLPPDASLSDLTIDGSTVSGFDSNTSDYTVYVPYGTTNVSVAGIPTDSNAKKVEVTGGDDLKVGSNTVTVVVTAQDDSTTQTYTLTVVRAESSDASLSDLTIDGSTVLGFDSSTTDYTVNVPYRTTSVSVAGTPFDPNAKKVEVAGGDDLKVGPNTVTVVVTAQDGSTTKTYTVNVVRAESSNASLSDLTIDGSTVPGFDSSSSDYTVHVPYGTTSVSVAGTPFDPNAKKVEVTGGDDLKVGPNTVTVIVTAPDGSTTKTYTVHVIRAGATYSPSPSPSAQTAPPAASLMIGNQAVSNVLTASWEEGTDGKILNLELSDEHLASLLTSQGADIEIESGSLADQIRLRLDREALLALRKSESRLIIRGDAGEIRLPMKQLIIDEEQATSINVSITGSKKPAAASPGIDLLTDPIAIELTQTIGNEVKKVSSASYLEIALPLPDGFSSSHLATAVALGEDGSFSPRPTRVVGNTALFSSLDAGTFALASGQTEFGDTAGHWAEPILTEMASRLLINGNDKGSFEPNASVTRAEFVSVLARGLGLAGNPSDETFADVEPTDWYSGPVQAAIEQGIIAGYEDGTFGPADTVTREEAFTMLARALRLTGLTSSESSGLSALDAFADHEQLSAWSRESAAALLSAGLVNGISGNLEPHQSMTRAEMVVLVQRLLKQSGLI